jgi:hypothetical protein
LKATFLWDQVPFFYSIDTRTPYSSPAIGVFRLNDSFQSAVQSAAATTSVFAADLRPFDLRSQRNTAEARLDYRATPTLDLRASFISFNRTGAQPWGASFGQSNAVELAVPIDRRTNDVNTTAEWSNDRAMGRLAYDAHGSTTISKRSSGTIRCARQTPREPRRADGTCRTALHIP